MKRILLCIAIALAISFIGCTNPNHAYQVLQSNGYTDIHITGYQFLACSDSDTFSTGFTATAPGGRVVTGVVCEGWMKKATIRFD